MVHNWKVLAQWCQILGNGAWDPRLYSEGYLAYMYTRFLIRQPQRKYAAQRKIMVKDNRINVVFWQGMMVYMRIIKHVI